MESDSGFVDGYCRSCGRRITQRDRYCAACGRPNSVLDEERPSTLGAGNARTGGLLLILSAVLSLISLPIMKGYLDSMDLPSYSLVYLGAIYLLRDVFVYVAVFLGIMASVSILGGLAAISGGSFTWARAGGITSVFGMSGAIGMAGLILIFASKGEFRGQPIAEQGLGPQEPRRPNSPSKRGEYGQPAGDSLQKSILVRR